MQRRTPVTAVSAILASLLLPSCATSYLLHKTSAGIDIVNATITHVETAALTKKGSLIVCFLGSKLGDDGDRIYHLTLPLKSYRTAAALPPSARDRRVREHRQFFEDRRHGTTIRLRAEDMFEPACPIQPMPKDMRPFPVLGAPPFQAPCCAQPRLPVPDNFTEVLYVHTTNLSSAANLTYATQDSFVKKDKGEPTNYLIFKFHGKKKPRRNRYLRVLLPLTVAVDVVTIPVQVLLGVIMRRVH